MTYRKLEHKVRYTLTYLLFFHADLQEVTVAYFIIIFIYLFIIYISIDIQLKLG